MKKNSGKAFIITKPKHRTAEGRPQLLRMEFAAQHTKIDFGYQTTSFYIRGGWVKISPKTYLQIHGGKEKLLLVRADNITLSPQKHNFSSTKDWLYFSLYFPPVPFKNCKLDLIEKLNGDEHEFNYFDIVIKEKEGVETDKR